MMTEQEIESILLYGCLRDIPEEQRTEKVCLEAIRNAEEFKHGDYGMLDAIPKKLRMPEFYAEAARAYKPVLEHIPEEFKERVRTMLGWKEL